MLPNVQHYCCLHCFQYATPLLLLFTNFGGHYCCHPVFRANLCCLHFATIPNYPQHYNLFLSNKNKIRAAIKPTWTIAVASNVQNSVAYISFIELYLLSTKSYLLTATQTHTSTHISRIYTTTHAILHRFIILTLRKITVLKTRITYKLSKLSSVT